MTCRCYLILVAVLFPREGKGPFGFKAHSFCTALSTLAVAGSKKAQNKQSWSLKGQCHTSKGRIMISKQVGLHIKCWRIFKGWNWGKILVFLLFFFFLLAGFLSFIYFIFFWPCPTACGILVPPPGIEPAPPALEAWSLNHWTAREVPRFLYFLIMRSLLAMSVKLWED